MFCSVTYVMSCYINMCHVVLYNMCHVMLYNMCHILLYNMPSARDLQAFLVFSQHPAWVITPVNP